ncbi:hypothetical protein DL96DRAFT_1714662 [Flagelloscypha sp. PMI_526]|nr:hypothetical protein DL96DRAFT_1714662 [Flagelloscypha sp. PMI_526]
MSYQFNTPEDFLLFNSDMAIGISASLLSGAFCYGVFVVLTLVALQILGKRPAPHARPTKILLWTIIFLWGFFTAFVSLQAVGYIQVLRWPRMGPSEQALKERYNSMVRAHKKVLQAIYTLHPIPYMIADAVPIWRAYLLWAHSKLARTVLVTLCLINMCFCVTRSVLEFLVNMLDSVHVISKFLYPTQLGFSTVTNAVVTIAIGIRAWHHRELTKDLRRTSSSPVYVLIVLVEAGAFLCFTQVVNLVMTICSFSFGSGPNSPFSLTGFIFGAIGDTVAAAYPALIVIVLSFCGSMLDATHPSAGTLYRSEGVTDKNIFVIAGWAFTDAEVADVLRNPTFRQILSDLSENAIKFFPANALRRLLENQLLEYKDEVRFAPIEWKISGECVCGTVIDIGNRWTNDRNLNMIRNLSSRKRESESDKPYWKSLGLKTKA